MRRHYVKQLEETNGDKNAAWQYATEIFQKHLDMARNKNGSAGPLRIGNYTMAKDGRTGSYFINHTPSPGNPTPSTIKPIIDRVRQLKTIDRLSDELVIPQALLNQFDRTRKSTGRIQMPILAQKIADQFGGQVRPVDVLNRQLQLAGLEQVPVKEYEQKMARFDPVYQRLITYRTTPTRVDIASIGSNQAAAFRPENPMNSVAAMLLQRGLSEEEAVTMTAIMMAESFGRAGVVNDNPRTRDLSYGLFQINMRDELGPARMKQYGLSSYDDLKDPRVNTDIAVKMMRASGYGPWGAYTDGRYKSFMDSARQAVRASQVSLSASPWRQGANMNASVLPQLMGMNAKQRTIAVGRQLLQSGYKAWQHPNFNADTGFVPGGRQRVMRREYDSAHHHAEALDYPLSHNTPQQLDQLYQYLTTNQKQLGIRKVLWRDGGMHENHLHVEFDHKI